MGGGDFSLDIDPARGLLRVRMCGFFTVEDVARYHAAISQATKTLPQPPSEQVMVNDISEMMIQSQEIVAAFQRVMGDPRYAGRRIGFVVVSSLARVQLSRIIGSRTAQIFSTEADAEAWLFAPPPPRRRRRLNWGQSICASSFNVFLEIGDQMVDVVGGPSR